MYIRRFLLRMRADRASLLRWSQSIRSLRQVVEEMADGLDSLTIQELDTGDHRTWLVPRRSEKWHTR